MLPNVAFASRVIDWYGLTCRLAWRGVNLFSPTRDVLGRLPPVAFVNGFDSDAVWRRVNEATSHALPFAPFSLAIRRWVSEYSTESRTMGRNGESTVSKRMTRF